MLNRRVLVLNQDFTPISVCNVDRAFILVFRDKAEVVQHARDLFIRTVTRQFPMPAVIRLHRYIHIPYKEVMLTRQNIFKRDNHSCQYCGVKSNLTIDHVIPRSKGGHSSWKNLVTACKKCNARKGDFLLHEVGMKLRTRPYKPSYVLFLRDFSGFSIDEWHPYLSSRSA